MATADVISELLLSAMYKDPKRGLKHSFFFGKPGERYALGFGGGGTTLYYNSAAMTECALAYRQDGPPHLRYLPLEEVRSLLSDFVSQYYGILAKETFLARFDTSYAETVSPMIKKAFAAAMAQSDLFHPQQSRFLFPLSPLQMSAAFDGSVFALCAAGDLTTERLETRLPTAYLTPTQFPPSADFQGRKEAVTSWLVVKSPARRAARKWRAAILGAAALAPYYRHRFSGRKIVSGVCEITAGGGVSFSFGETHTPPLSDDLVLSLPDHAWLSRMDALLQAHDDQSRRYVRALQYFYRAWPRDAVERFPLMFMTLDAVFGEKNNATQIVIDAIRNLLGSHIDEKRLRDLMDMRASVIHGGSPDIYDSSKYPKYIRKYDADPISDLEDVVAACLRQRIFDGALLVRDDPHRELVERLVAEGELPANHRPRSILDPPPKKQA